MTVTSLGRISLVAVLLVAASTEVLLHRIGSNLPMIRSSVLYPAIRYSGLFALHFTAVLAAAIAIWATVVVVRDRRLLSIPGRTAVSIAGALFLPLAAVGVLVPLGRLAPYLNSAFALMLIALLIAFLSRPTSLRAKLGVLYLAAPLFLHCYWLITQQIPSLAPQQNHDLPTRLFEAGEQMVVVGAFAAFLFFPPRPSRIFEPIPLATALVVAGGVAVLMQTSYLVASQAADYGFGISLPAPSELRGALHLTALFFYVLTVVGLLARVDHGRIVGAGLLLIGLSGFQLKLPHQLLMTVLGIMLLIRGAIEARREQDAIENPTAAPPTTGQWKQYFGRLEVFDDDQGPSDLVEPKSQGPSDGAETVVLQNGDTQIVRVRGQRQQTPLMIRVVTTAETIDELEITIGRPPRQRPEASLVRRKGRRGRRPAGPQQSNGARLEFDSEFVLRAAASDLGDLLSDNAVRAELRQNIHGFLGIWSREALQYVARPTAGGWPLPIAAIASDSEAPIDDLATLLDLLSLVATRAGITTTAA